MADISLWLTLLGLFLSLTTTATTTTDAKPQRRIMKWFNRICFNCLTKQEVLEEPAKEGQQEEQVVEADQDEFNISKLLMLNTMEGLSNLTPVDINQLIQDKKWKNLTSDKKIFFVFSLSEDKKHLKLLNYRNDLNKNELVFYELTGERMPHIADEIGFSFFESDPLPRKTIVYYLLDKPQFTDGQAYELLHRILQEPNTAPITLYITSFYNFEKELDQTQRTEMKTTIKTFHEKIMANNEISIHEDTHRRCLLQNPWIFLDFDKLKSTYKDAYVLTSDCKTPIGQLLQQTNWIHFSGAFSVFTYDKIKKTIGEVHNIPRQGVIPEKSIPFTYSVVVDDEPYYVAYKCNEKSRKLMELMNFFILVEIALDCPEDSDPDDGTNSINMIIKIERFYDSEEREFRFTYFGYRDDLEHCAKLSDSYFENVVNMVEKLTVKV